MKKFFKKLGFHKMDEMEMTIELKSFRWAWLYTVLFLFVWFCYECFRVKTPETPINFLPLMLLSSQNIICYIARAIYNKKMTGNADEE
jgi:hypothetical protein